MVNKNNIPLKHFLLTLLLGFTDSAVVMGAEEGAPSMMVNTNPQLRQSTIEKELLMLFNKEGWALGNHRFKKQI